MPSNFTEEMYAYLLSAPAAFSNCKHKEAAIKTLRQIAARLEIQATKLESGEEDWEYIYWKSKKWDLKRMGIDKLT